MRHPIRWLLAASLAANIVLLSGILYLKVPAIHEALLPVWRAVHGVSPTSATSPGAESKADASANLRSGQITLAVADDKSGVRVFLPNPKTWTYVVVLDSGQELRLDAREASFFWPLHDGQSRNAPNAATVWTADAAGERTKIGDLEIYRVSAEDGKESLGAERENGWLFVGRCTFEIVSSPRTALTVRESGVLAGLTADERSRIASLFCDSAVWKRDAPGIAGLLDNLGRASTYLCSRGLKYISPTNNERLYAELPSAALLAVLRREIGVQCQGFRSVFVWVVLSCGWLAADQIREVDASRHDAIVGLDTTSHALLEVRSPAGGWVAVDPLAQVVFADETGRYLSAEQIAVLRRSRQLDRIRVLPLSEACASDTVTNASTQTPYWMGPSFDDRDSANYNYWCTFSRLVVRSLNLPD